MSEGEHRGPLDERDFSRRTLLANERTYLAWWRTGLTTLTVALASARIVPEVSGSEDHWPWTVIGVTFGVLGIACLLYGERRRKAVDQAVRRGDFADPDPRVTTALTTTAVLAGIGLIVLMLFAP